ncbi:MAG: transcription antitermination factor NusB [Pseudomonadota bacterium]
MKPRSPAPSRRARSASRLAAVQALYQMEVTGAPMPKVRQEFEQHRLGAPVDEEGGAEYHEADLDLFRAILAGVIANQSRIDRLTDAALVERWPLGRIDATLRALFRAGGFELAERPDIPPKVVIGEYVDVAKAFFAEGKEAKFVNGVLDHMARAARPGALDPR